jgi:hypothetical protein
MNLDDPIVNVGLSENYGGSYLNFLTKLNIETILISSCPTQRAKHLHPAACWHSHPKSSNRFWISPWISHEQWPLVTEGGNPENMSL